ncbi:hypothetical protein X801_05604, partial [Opisthorchis viverrini]
MYSTCLAFPRQVGRFVAVGHSDGRAVVYDMRKQLTLRTRIELPSTSSSTLVPSCIAWAARDRLFVVGIKNSPDLYVCLAASTEDTCPRFALLPHIPTMDIPCAQQNTICLTLRTCRLDSTLVAAGYSSGEIIIWQLDWPLSQNPGDHIFFRCHPRHDLLSITWSPTDTYTLFTSGSPDLNLRLWSVVPASFSGEPLKELVAPEINSPELSDSDFHRTSLLDKPFSAPVVSRPCSIDQPHVSSAGLCVPQSRPNTILSSQAIDACSAGATENSTGSLTKKYLDDFRADIQLSHVNMLYHFSRLEEKVENMFERFSEALVELKKENDELRLQLDR